MYIERVKDFIVSCPLDIIEQITPSINYIKPGSLRHVPTP